MVWNVILAFPIVVNYWKAKGANLSLIQTFTEIAPGIMLTGEVPQDLFEKGDPNLKLKCENGYRMQLLMTRP